MRAGWGERATVEGGRRLAAQGVSRRRSPTPIGQIWLEELGEIDPARQPYLTKVHQCVGNVEGRGRQAQDVGMGGGERLLPQGGRAHRPQAGAPLCHTCTCVTSHSTRSHVHMCHSPRSARTTARCVCQRCLVTVSTCWTTRTGCGTGKRVVADATGGGHRRADGTHEPSWAEPTAHGAGQALSGPIIPSTAPTAGSGTTDAEAPWGTCIAQEQHAETGVGRFPPPPHTTPPHPSHSPPRKQCSQHTLPNIHTKSTRITGSLSSAQPASHRSA